MVRETLIPHNAHACAIYLSELLAAHSALSPPVFLFPACPDSVAAASLLADSLCAIELAVDLIVTGRT